MASDAAADYAGALLSLIDLNRSRNVENKFAKLISTHHTVNNKSTVGYAEVGT